MVSKAFPWPATPPPTPTQCVTPASYKQNINCRRVGCGSTSSSREGRVLNTNVKWTSVVHACNLRKRFSSLMSISMGYAAPCNPRPPPCKGVSSSQTTGLEGGLCQSKMHKHAGKHSGQEKPITVAETDRSNEPTMVESATLPQGSARKHGGYKPASLHQCCQHHTISQCPL